MERNNNFNKILIGVLIFHIILLYILPGMKEIVIEKPKLTRITLGENNTTIDTAPKKQIEKPKITKEVEKKEVVKEVVPKPVVEEKKIIAPKKEVVKEQPVKKEVVKEPIKDTVKAMPEILETTQSIDDLDILTTPDEGLRKAPIAGNERPEIVKVEDVKKVVREKRELNSVSKDVKADVVSQIEDVKPTIDSSTNEISVGSSSDNSIELANFENIMSSDNESIIGPKSGLKVGSVDGGSRVEWDSNNKDPEYPLEAEKNAQTADVKVTLDVDANGKVLKVLVEKTGVEVIDRAVEKAAYTWNVKLVNNGMAIKGKIMVEYKFRLKGRE